MAVVWPVLNTDERSHIGNCDAAESGFGWSSRDPPPWRGDGGALYAVLILHRCTPPGPSATCLSAWVEREQPRFDVLQRLNGGPLRHDGCGSALRTLGARSMRMGGRSIATRRLCVNCQLPFCSGWMENGGGNGRENHGQVLFQASRARRSLETTSTTARPPSEDTLAARTKPQCPVRWRDAVTQLTQHKYASLTSFASLQVCRFENGVC